MMDDNKQFSKDFQFSMGFNNVYKKGKQKQMIEGFVSMETSKRDRDVIPPEAFNIETYMQNPQVWYNHGPWYDENKNEVPIGKTTFLTVAQVKEVNSDFIVVDTRDEKQPMLGVITAEKAQSLTLSDGDVGLWAKIHITVPEVWDMIKDGQLNAFSWQGRVRFTEETANVEGKEVKFEKIEAIDLVEISVVQIPANERAIFSIAKSLFSVNSDIESVRRKADIKIEKKDSELKDEKLDKVPKVIKGLFGLKVKKEDANVDRYSEITEILKDSKCTVVISEEEAYKGFVEKLSDEEFSAHKESLLAIKDNDQKFSISLLEEGEDVSLKLEVVKAVEKKEEVKEEKKEEKAAEKSDDIKSLGEKISALEALVKELAEKKIEEKKEDVDEKKEEKKEENDLMSILAEKLGKVLDGGTMESHITDELTKSVKLLTDELKKAQNTVLTSKSLKDIDIEDVGNVKEASLEDVFEDVLPDGSGDLI